MNEQKAPVILLADDSPTTRAVLRMTLARSGYIIAGEAKDGEEMVQLFSQLHPDLVITDLSMPKLNGVEALKQILEIDPRARVLVVSGHGNTVDSEQVNSALAGGACGFVSKSGDKEALVAAVRDALAKG